MLPEPVRQVRLLYDRWGHHRSLRPQFRYGIGGEENILQPLYSWFPLQPPTRILDPSDLTSTYSVCTRRVFGAIGYRTQALWLGVQCSKPLSYHKVLRIVNVIIHCWTIAKDG
ncbi:hypothetical protein TNCV_460961 [Trichonephila clavipes]|nr:hypothetical protein TNCV_460961 [Trichonephila clavipes]